MGAFVSSYPNVKDEFYVDTAAILPFLPDTYSCPHYIPYNTRTTRPALTLHTPDFLDLVICLSGSLVAFCQVPRDSPVC